VGLFLKPNERQELEIVRLAKGGSAERSGQILPGDIVFEVDGEDVYKKDFNVFAKLIQGPVGTFVEVKVFKQGDYSRINQVVLERTLNPEDSRPPPAGSPPQQGAVSRGPEPPRQAMVSRQAGAAPTVGGAGGDIGIEFKTDETGCFQITGLKPGGPAQLSGLVDIGDILYEIEGVKVLYGIGPNGRPLSNIEITEMLRGPEGSVMNLRLQKGRMGRLATVNLTRTSMPSQPRSTMAAQPMQQGGVSPPPPQAKPMAAPQAPRSPPKPQQMAQPAPPPPQAAQSMPRPPAPG
jgi:C-terminal processing protease CtpA/Prc